MEQGTTSASLLYQGKFADDAYLRQFGGDTDKAKTYEKEGEAWRKEFRPDLIKLSSVKDVIEKYGLFVAGRGTNGSLTLWMDCYGKAHVPISELPYECICTILTGFIYAIEHAITTENPRVNIVVNCAGVKKKQVDERFLRVITETLSLAYPDSLGALGFFNVPPWLSMAYTALYPFVPKVWRDKVFYSTTASSSAANRSVRAQPALDSIIPREELPQRYGGTRSDEEFSSTAFIEAMKKCEKPKSEELVQKGFPHFLWIEKLECPANKLDVGVAFRGKMKKPGGVVPIWRSFYFLLRADRKGLFYFKKDSDLAPQGAVNLMRASVKSIISGDIDHDTKKMQIRGFKVVTPLRTFYFLCKTEKERNKWVLSLNKVIVG